MSKRDLKDILSATNEIDLTVRGRKSTVKISANGQELSGKAKMITDENKVKEIVEKFRSKYGNSDVQKYYTKFDVCIEFALK
jgi:hypothetical protein